MLPPLPYLGELVEHFGERGIQFGAQDVSVNEKGAYTGEVSAAMLLDVGAQYGLVGHSERRQYHGETSELVAAEVLRGQAGGLTPILCVGESLREREAGQTEWRIEEQLEPIFELAAPRPWTARSSRTSRSGRSAPAGRRPRSRRRPSMPSSVARSLARVLRLPARCRSSTGAA